MYRYVGRVMIPVLWLAVLLISNIGCVNINVPNAPSTSGQTQASQTPAAKTVEPVQGTNPRQVNLKPDLLFTYLNLEPTKYNLGMLGGGDGYKIHYVVGNKGKAPSTECRMALKKDGQVLNMVTIPALPPEGGIQGDFPIILGPLHKEHQQLHPTYEVIVDYERVVDESNEDNNTFVAQWDLDPVY